MSFNNRIRLPLKLHKPQFVEDAERYRKANGVTVTLSVVVRKIYEALTDSIPEKLHERLKIALVHDHVEVEGDKYVGLITQDGDYQIEWQDFLSHPLAQGKFKAEVTPFNATNSNCGTCEEMIQIVCVDDNIGTIVEDTDYTINPLANDKICCNPASISIVTFNTAYIENLVINPDNTLSFHVKNPVDTANSVTIITYRVQCENGQFDEANVIADIDGGAPVCLAPTGLNITDLTYNDCNLNWTEPSPAPFGYEIKLYRSTDLVNYYQLLGAPGGTTTRFINGLDPNSSYRITMRSICDPNGVYSNTVYLDFTTPAQPPMQSCGQYRLFNTDDQNTQGFDYIRCDGVESGNVNIPPLHERVICALQYSPGNPVDISADGTITITYQGLC